MPLDPYARYARSTNPPWLGRRFGAGWNEAMGLFWDILADAARKAVLARVIEQAPDDALPFAGSDRLLEPMPGERAPAWRARLLTAWDAWAWAGTKKGVLDALALMGLTNAEIYEAADWGQGNRAEWARFTLVVRQPHPWLGPIQAGARIFTRRGLAVPRAGEGYVCGIGRARPDDIARLRRLIRLWKPAHAKAEPARVLVGGALAGTGALCGQGLVCGAGSVAHITI